MRNFKESLCQNNLKSVDKTIIIAIKNVMQELENSADIEQYVTQIRNRRDGIIKVLANFNHDMTIIEENKRFANSRIKSKEKISCEKALDNIIKRRIENKINCICESMKETESDDSDEINKVLTQMQDRKVKIDYLLSDYTSNMSILEDYREPQIITNCIVEMPSV